MESGTEDRRLGPSTISDSEVEKHRILEEEDKRRQIDKKMREQGKAKEEFSTVDSHADPVLILLRDLDDDIGNLMKRWEKFKLNWQSISFRVQIRTK